MVLTSRIRWRLALAIAATAILPLLVAVVVARSMVRQTAERFYMPEIGARLDQSLSLYQELAKSIKTAMRHAADAIAARGSLVRAARQAQPAALTAELERAIAEYPGLVSLRVETDDDRLLAEANRGVPVDPAREKQLELERTLGEDGPVLKLLFVTDRGRLDELEGMSRFVDAYHQMEQRRGGDERSYVLAFAALLGITVLVSVGAGLVLARRPTVQLVSLAAALERMGTGDLTVRVPERGHDEIGDLARAFNRMVEEIESSRARIEYLQRLGAWQEMARRLAHEIKNPLTPILLAVQEVHERCPAELPAFARLVSETRHIVEDEVETLRRLVSEFSGFARMPEPELVLLDLREYLMSRRRGFELLDDTELAGDETPSPPAETGAAVAFELLVPDQPALAYVDPQLLKRAIINLVKNAVQALTGAGRKDGEVELRLFANGDFWVLDVNDNGPGIPEEMRSRIFEPYVTTKESGTGLGLAITKKIVVEHGGTISVGSSDSGGARMRIRLPKPGTSRARGLRAGLELEPETEAPPSSRANPAPRG